MSTKSKLRPIGVDLFFGVSCGVAGLAIIFSTAVFVYVQAGSQICFGG